MKKAVSIFVALCIILSCAVFAQETNQRENPWIIIEGEDCNINNLSVVLSDDDKAHNGKYVQLRGNRLNSPSEITEPVDLSFDFEVDNDGEYYIYALTKCKTDGNNSFWCKVDDEEWLELSLEYGNEWVFTMIVNKMPLKKGEHIIKINHRESMSGIDFFFISDEKYGIPENVVTESDGTIKIEYTKQGDWRDIVLDFEAGTPENFTVRRIWNVSSFEEFEHAKQNLAEGDEIVFADGEYTGAMLKLSNVKGNKSAPIRIRAKNPGKTVFTGNFAVMLENCEYVELSGFYFKDVVYNRLSQENQFSSTQVHLSNSRYCRITNNYFERCGTLGSGGGGNNVRLSDGSNNNRVDHNTFDDSYSIQVGLGASTTGKDSRNTQNHIDHNHFVNIQFVGTVQGNEYWNGMESVQLGSVANLAKLNTKVEYNLFENVIGDKSEIISSKSCNNIFIGNSFVDCHSGLTLRYADGNIVRENYFKNCTKGIRLYGKRHLIENNYLENISAGIGIEVGRGFVGNGYGVPDDITIQNNTVMLSGGTGISLDPRKELAEGYEIGDNYVLKDNIVVSNCGSAYMMMPEQTVVSEGNVAVTLEGAAQSVKNDGIDYLASMSEIALPQKPSEVTTEIAGATWKKGVDTNTEYVTNIEKFQNAVVLAENRDDAVAQLKLQKIPFVVHEIDGEWFVPLKFVAEKIGAEVIEEGMKCTVIYNGREMSVEDGSNIMMVDGKKNTLYYKVYIKNGDFVVHSDVIKHGLKMNMWQNFGMIIFTPSDVKINNAINVRYIDRLFVGNAMLLLGGFETAPDFYVDENENYDYEIPFMKAADGGYLVGVSPLLGKEGCVLYVVQYDVGKRIIQLKSQKLDIEESENVFVEMERSNEACLTKAFILKGVIPASGWIAQ